MKIPAPLATPRSLLLSALLLALAGAPLRAAPVESVISAVTVYSDRAVVTRTLSAPVSQPGTVEVVLDHLPADLMDESLQVAGSGTAPTTLLDVTPRTTQVDFAPDERVKTLEDDIRQLQMQARGLDDRAVVLREQNSSLNAIEHASTQAPSKDVPRMTIDEAYKFLGFLEEQRGKITSEERSIGDQKEALAAKQAAAERQLADLRGAGSRSYKSVTIRLEAAGAGSLDLSVSYAVPGASWEPSYDARATSADHAVALGYFGIVRQSTGEDWKNVSLTLSTARPSAGGAPPGLGSWILDVPHLEREEMSEDKAVVLNRFDLESGKVQAASASPSNSPMVVTAQYLHARVESQVTSATFRIPVATTVPSDNSPQKVPVTTIALSAKPEYLAIPKEVLAAFLTDKVVNSSDYPLITGPMNVFLDGTFVASGRIATVMPGEKFDLELGADDSIALTRKLNSRFTEDTGIVSKKTRITYDYTIAVQNNKRTAAKVVLVDQVPVSRNENIVVSVDVPKEEDAKREPDGTLRWTLDLQAGEKRELPLKFSVEYPSATPVTGLE